MNYFNDERYWNINLLNKWFAISSILFLISIVWMFIDDNDDAFKGYQKDFRKLEIIEAEKKLESALVEVEAERSIYEEKYEIQLSAFETKAKQLEELNALDLKLKAQFYKANMEFLGQKAFVDEAKYLYEAEEIHLHETDEYANKQLKNLNSQAQKLQELKLIKEKTETFMLSNQSEIKNLRLGLKSSEDEMNLFLKEVNLTDKKLKQLDRQKMTFANKVGDFVRDLPIIDFLDPYYEVKQNVITDIKYDVNFANVSTVDRCTSCHLGISNPDFEDAEQPFTTHPNLDLYLTSSSPHPVEQYGCTSCHDGRSRGTTFNSSVHEPNSKEDKERWEDEYDWKTMHHWIKPMMPTRYSQSACFNCHENKPFLEGGEKINYGLSLIKRNGCNNCHHIESYPKRREAGPSLLKLNTKTSKEWVSKWIKDPKSFRHNTIMPAFFGQSNNSDPASVSRTDTEISAITEYLFEGGEKFKKVQNKRYLGDNQNGEVLFNTLGCMGCHMIAETPDEVPEENSRYDILNGQGPNLINLGSKTSAEWVYKWIKNPKEYWPETKMPDLRLSDSEAKDITSYLMSFSDESFEEIGHPEINSKELDKIAFGWLKKVYPEEEASSKLDAMDYDDRVGYVADKSIRYYGCYTCHEIKGYENEKPIGAELTHVGSKPLNKFDFGHIHDIDHNNYSWFEQKLKDPRIFDRDKVLEYEDKSRMPNYYFTDQEIEAIVTALLGFSSDNISENVIADQLPEDVLEGHRIINDLNCQGCHIIENFGGKISETISVPGHAPPNLNTQGIKTQPEWLYNFLKNPSIIRPPLQARMPSFNLSDSDWNAIIKAFQSLEDNNLSFESIHNFDINSDQYKAGVKLENLGACNNCHFYGTSFPKQGAQTWAPNLAMTKDRLRYNWVVEWLRDPQKIMPGTLMPAPYLPTEDVLSTDDAEEIWGKSLVNMKGDHDKMLKGLTDKIYSIKGKSDISKEVKAYFKENGYDFGGDEEDEDDEDW